jgi:hypothetical protein
LFFSSLVVLFQISIWNILTIFIHLYSHFLPPPSPNTYYNRTCFTTLFFIFKFIFIVQRCWRFFFIMVIGLYFLFLCPFLVLILRPYRIYLEGFIPLQFIWNELYGSEAIWSHTFFLVGEVLLLIRSLYIFSLFRFSISSLFSLKVWQFVSSRLWNLLFCITYTNLYNPLYFCDISCNVSFFISDCIWVFFLFFLV